MSIGNCASCSPAATCSAAAWIARDTPLGSRPSSALTEAADAFTSPSARMKPRGIGRPDTGKFRSEEHTSELQSLMRISYAVFCLKKKKHMINYQTKKLAIPTHHT